MLVTHRVTGSAHRRHRLRISSPLAVAMVAAAVSFGCVSDNDAVEPALTVAPVPEPVPSAAVLAPDALAAPWCDELIALDDESLSRERVVEVYRNVASEAPAALAIDLRAVADAFAAGDDAAAWQLVPTSSAPTTSLPVLPDDTVVQPTATANTGDLSLGEDNSDDSPVPGEDAEVRAPDLTPQDRIAAFLDEHCRGVATTPEVVDGAELSTDVSSTVP